VERIARGKSVAQGDLFFSPKRAICVGGAGKQHWFAPRTRPCRLADEHRGRARVTSKQHTREGWLRRSVKRAREDLRSAGSQSAGSVRGRSAEDCERTLTARGASDAPLCLVFVHGKLCLDLGQCFYNNRYHDENASPPDCKGLTTGKSLHHKRQYRNTCQKQSAHENHP